MVPESQRMFRPRRRSAESVATWIVYRSCAVLRSLLSSRQLRRGCVASVPMGLARYSTRKPTAASGTCAMAGRAAVTRSGARTWHTGRDQRLDTTTQDMSESSAVAVRRVIQPQRCRDANSRAPHYPSSMLRLSLMLLQAVPAPAPQRGVPDPGVIATNQRITPAGLQSVFQGRVTGLHFGRTSDEIWVAAAGTVYRMAWAENRLRAQLPISGRAGIYGLALDVTSG